MFTPGPRRLPSSRRDRKSCRLALYVELQGYRVCQVRDNLLCYLRCLLFKSFRIDLEVECLRRILSCAPIPHGCVKKADHPEGFLQRRTGCPIAIKLRYMIVLVVVPRPRPRIGACLENERRRPVVSIVIDFRTEPTTIGTTITTTIRKSNNSERRTKPSTFWRGQASPLQ